MADQGPEDFIETMSRTTYLSLEVEGGRVFVHNADLENIEQSTIELKCSWSSSPEPSSTPPSESERIATGRSSGMKTECKSRTRKQNTRLVEP